MVGKKSEKILNVSMNGVLVGKLTYLGNQRLQFQYDDNWLTKPSSRPVSLSLPLSHKAFSDQRVYNFFDNLLPDSPDIRARIQRRFQTKTDQPFDLLAAIGQDCIGALQITEDVYNNIEQINATPLNEHEIAERLRHYYEAPLGMAKSVDDFRISIAGAQEKFAFLKYKEKWCQPHTTTPTSHIFKLPIGFLDQQRIDLTDSCENEWLCMQIAKAFGLNIAECELLQFEDLTVLCSQRFDRKYSTDGSWIMRLPQEDMCQALGLSPNIKYQSDGGPGIVDIMKLLLASHNSVDDQKHFFQTQILFWLLAAIDGHAKNFSVFIEPFSRYRLTPLYDIMSAYPVLENKQLPKQKIKMAMALKGKNTHYHWHTIQYRHFISTAENIGFNPQTAKHVLDEMLAQVDSVVEKVAACLPKNFPHVTAEQIFSGMLNMRDRLTKNR